MAVAPRPRSSPCRSAFAASMETAWAHGTGRAEGLADRGVATASNGVQLLCESCDRQRVSCRVMKGAGCTSAV
eukprot:3433008-Pleurochrysis_carterae.AAC.1